MIDQKIIDYLKTSIAKGKTKEDLYKELLGKGCTLEFIQDNFNAIDAKQENEDAPKRTIHIIVTIGTILVGAGIFSFIAANWQEMSRPLKIGIILSSMLVSYGVGWYVQDALKLEKTGAALFLLGTIIYGAGIFLVAQMFNMRTHWPDGFILWMFGALAVAFALESFPHFYLAIILGFVAVIGHPVAIFEVTLGDDPFLLTSSFLLLIVTIVTFITGWIIRKRMRP